MGKGRRARSQAALTVAAVGDIMLGSTWPEERLPPDDGATLLDGVRPFLAAPDLAFGNLEGPLADGGKAVDCRPNETDCHRFRMPTRYARLLRDAGFDVLSVANNHSYDFGPEGLASTKEALAAAGLAHAGPESAVARLEVNGKKVAVIAFAAWGSRHDINDPDLAGRLVSELSRDNDVVIVSFHGGAEGAKRERVPRGGEIYESEPVGDLRRFAHAVVDGGADLVLGHGPHVVRGMEVYKGRLIAYSLGNFATYDRFDLSGPMGLSLILEARLAGDGRFVGGRVIALRQPDPGGPRLDPEKTVLRRLRRLSRQDFGKNAVEIKRDGDLSPP